MIDICLEICKLYITRTSIKKQGVLGLTKMKGYDEQDVEKALARLLRFRILKNDTYDRMRSNHLTYLFIFHPFDLGVNWTLSSVKNHLETHGKDKVFETLFPFELILAGETKKAKLNEKVDDDLNINNENKF